MFFHRTLGAVFGLRPLFLPPPDLAICYRFANIGAFLRARCRFSWSALSTLTPQFKPAPKAGKREIRALWSGGRGLPYSTMQHSGRLIKARHSPHGALWQGGVGNPWGGGCNSTAAGKAPGSAA